MEKNNELFIKTKDEETRNTLVREGFDLVDYSAGVWTFLNCPKKYNVTNVDKTNVVFSNIFNV